MKAHQFNTKFLTYIFADSNGLAGKLIAILSDFMEVRRSKDHDIRIEASF